MTNSVPDFSHAVKMFEALQNGELDTDDLDCGQLNEIIAMLEYVANKLTEEQS